MNVSIAPINSPSEEVFSHRVKSISSLVKPDENMTADTEFMCRFLVQAMSEESSIKNLISLQEIALEALTYSETVNGRSMLRSYDDQAGE
jgi:hypothetical protein